ncbi:MAG: hypothetical protein IT291_01080 [Deltaproteobacteria bacterium]|nr:hypothetical protein [Deltaproteobacteria bacterium]
MVYRMMPWSIRLVRGVYTIYKKDFCKWYKQQVRKHLPINNKYRFQKVKYSTYFLETVYLGAFFIVVAFFGSLPGLALADMAWIDEATDCDDFRLRVRVYTEIASGLKDLSRTRLQDVNRIFNLACSEQFRSCDFRFCSASAASEDKREQANSSVITSPSFATSATSALPKVEPIEASKKLDTGMSDSPEVIKDKLSDRKNFFVELDGPISHSANIEWRPFTIDHGAIDRRLLTDRIMALQVRTRFLPFWYIRNSLFRLSFF